MEVKKLVSEIIPFVKLSDEISEVLNWMDIFKISHLPVVHKSKYLGLLSEAQIFDENKIDTKVIAYQSLLDDTFVQENQHIYEVIELAVRKKISVIPVLKQGKNYFGVIRFVDLAQEFFKLMEIENPGGILTLELNNYDYSLSEISQIVEGNDAKILNLYVGSNKDSSQLEVTLKINKTDLSGIIQTFQRYNYKIKSIYGNNNQVDTMLKDRVDMLLKYLDV